MKATGYSLASYGRMISCEPRMDAFAKALQRAIASKPQCWVIDLGAGPGLFALLACEYGAASVIAIEPSDSLEIGRVAAKDNGFSDRINFVKGLSTGYNPQRPADVIVSDIRGALPLFENHIPAIVDARERLLAPGGVLIPEQDRIYAAVVESVDTYARYDQPWGGKPYGIDLRSGRPFVVNSWGRVFLSPETLLTDAQQFMTLDYKTISEASHSGRLTWHAGRNGTAHGLLLWFETELLVGTGIGYTNAPGAPKLVYQQAFFPLEHPVQLAEGDKINVEISARFIDGDYVWNWSTEVVPAHGATVSFRQSSFKGQILSPEKLVPRAANFRPPARLGQEVDMHCLQRFDGETEISKIADELFELFPGFFATRQSAFDHVASLSARYNL